MPSISASASSARRDAIDGGVYALGSSPPSAAARTRAVAPSGRDRAFGTCCSEAGSRPSTPWPSSASGVPSGAEPQSHRYHVKSAAPERARHRAPVARAIVECQSAPFARSRLHARRARPPRVDVAASAPGRRSCHSAQTSAARRHPPPPAPRPAPGTGASGGTHPRAGRRGRRPVLQRVLSCRPYPVAGGAASIRRSTRGSQAANRSSSVDFSTAADQNASSSVMSASSRPCRCRARGDRMCDHVAAGPIQMFCAGRSTIDASSDRPRSMPHRSGDGS